MQLCILTEKDISRICLIENKAYISPWSEETFRHCFEANYLLFGLEEQDALFGYIVFSVHTNECHILNVAVHPDLQHQGIGRHLLSTALEYAKKKGVNMVYLEVRRSNKNAIALYEQLEFIQIGERKNYYPGEKSREDALVFAKNL